MDTHLVILNNVKLPKRKYKKRPMNSSRQLAIDNNDKYYQGNPCKKGHIGKRLTLDGQCVECRSILRKKHNNKNRLRSKKWELKKYFGISINEYDDLVKKQNNLCAICNRPERAAHYKTKIIKQLAVDHCHSTGKIRGLLCYTCNVGIGLLNHDVGIIHKAALYCEEV